MGEDEDEEDVKGDSSMIDFQEEELIEETESDAEEQSGILKYSLYAILFITKVSLTSWIKDDM